MAKTTIEHLTELLNTADRRTAILENKLKVFETIRDYMWLLHKTEPRDVGGQMPVPRIEMRVRRIDDYSAEWLQYLVLDPFFTEDDDAEVLLVPLGRTTTSAGGTKALFEKDAEPHLPYRDGAHMFHHMAQLKLRGFLTREVDGELDHCKELTLDHPEVRHGTKEKYKLP